MCYLDYDDKREGRRRTVDNEYCSVGQWLFMDVIDTFRRIGVPHAVHVDTAVGVVTAVHVFLKKDYDQIADALLARGADALRVGLVRKLVQELRFNYPHYCERFALNARIIAKGRESAFPSNARLSTLLRPPHVLKDYYMRSR